MARCSSSGRASPGASRASRRLALAACASAARAAHWAQPARPVDALGRQGGRAGGVGRARHQARAASRSRPTRPAWYHPGRSGSCAQGRTVLAALRRAAPGVLAALDLAAPLVAFELDLDVLPMPKARAEQGAPGARAVALPAGRPRLRLHGRRGVPAAALLDAVQGADQTPDPRDPAVRRLRGHRRRRGKKSLAIGVRLQAARPHADRGRDRGGGRTRSSRQPRRRPAPCCASQTLTFPASVATLATAVWRSLHAHDVGKGCQKSLWRAADGSPASAGNHREERQAGSSLAVFRRSTSRSSGCGLTRSDGGMVAEAYSDEAAALGRSRCGRTR